MLIGSMNKQALLLAAVFALGCPLLTSATPLFVIDGGGAVTSSGDATLSEGAAAGPGWAANWQLSTPTKTRISIIVNFTSNRAFTDEFEFIASVPTTDSFNAPTVAFGSSSLSVLDNVMYGDGAEVAAVPDDMIYIVYLNNKRLAGRMDAPFSLSAAPYRTNSSGPHEFHDINGPAVNPGDVLKIRHKFTLSAWDTVQFVSTAVITPEPATLGFLFLGGLLYMGRRGRH